jgi:hypothetical protein
MDLALVLLHVKEMHRHTRFEVDALLDRCRDYNRDRDDEQDGWDRECFLEEERRMAAEERKQEERRIRNRDQLLEEERRMDEEERESLREEEERRILALEKAEIEVQRKRVEHGKRELQEAVETTAESQLEEDIANNAAEEKRLRDIRARDISRRCFVDNCVVPWEDGAGLGPMTHMCSRPSMSVRVSLVIPEALTFTF